MCGKVHRLIDGDEDICGHWAGQWAQVAIAFLYAIPSPKVSEHLQLPRATESVEASANFFPTVAT